MNVDTTAAAPNTGHDQPNKEASGTTAFAITGKNVAGMM